MLIETTDVNLMEEDRDEIIRQAQTMAFNDGEQLERIAAWVDQEGYLCFQPFYRRDIKRVRRITGYFSEVKNFNDAKKAELQDRVAHL